MASSLKPKSDPLRKALIEPILKHPAIRSNSLRRDTLRLPQSNSSQLKRTRATNPDDDDEDGGKDNDEAYKPKRRCFWSGDKPATSKKPFVHLLPASVLNTSKAKTLNTEDPPLSTLPTIFDTIVSQSCKMGEYLPWLQTIDMVQIIMQLRDNSLNVMTMCSGTEAPILAMQMIQESLRRSNIPAFDYKHVASAEIEPFKQAYIHRNFPEAVIFADVTDFSKPVNQKSQEAQTAYGGVKPWPADIHLLVAGSSCKDFSVLNKNRTPNLQDANVPGGQGQSAATMDGVKAFVRIQRPRMFILENVKTAPWEDMQKSWDEIEYDVKVVFVDTKNFYLPQTRQRGYMLGIDRRWAAANNFDTIAARRLWTDILANLQFRASAPFIDFAFPEDHPHIQKYREDSGIARGINPAKKEIAWTACHSRYDRYRSEKELGRGRPATQWKSSGSTSYYDHFWMQWSQTQRERIHDTVDIHHLNCAIAPKRGWDSMSKHRVIELSQNVDRDEDSRPMGLIGCITPTGLGLLTTRGGLLDGREALALQGLPLENISLPTERTRQCQDLAGNAMSTTVVGCAMWAAMLMSQIMTKIQPGNWLPRASKRKAPNNDEDLEYQDSEVRNQLAASLLEAFPSQQCAPGNTNHKEAEPSRTPDDILRTSTQWLTEPGELLARRNLDNEPTLDKVSATAIALTQLCQCEGYTSKTANMLTNCIICGHSVCTQCAGNPPHKPWQFNDSFLKQRGDPVLELAELADKLPRSVRFSQSQRQALVLPDRIDLDEKLRSRLTKAISNAFNEPLRLVDKKRGTVIKFVYESPTAKLEFRFSRKRGKLLETRSHTHGGFEAKWLIFARAAADEPAGSQLRLLLEQPIAKLEPESSLQSGQWSLHNFDHPKVRLHLVTHASGRTTSWRCDLGIKASEYLKEATYSSFAILGRKNDVDKYTVLRSILGPYILQKDCSQAESSLHRLVQNPETPDEAMFFFLDPRPLGPQSDDSMVFSHDTRRLANQDFRIQVAKFPAGWRNVASGWLTYNGFDDLVHRFVDCEITDNWTSAPGIEFGVDILDQCVWRPTLQNVALDDDHNNHDDSPFLLLEMPIEDNKNLWKDGVQTVITVQDKPQGLKEFSWLTHLSGSIQGMNEWHTVDCSGLSKVCPACSPSLPAFRWESRKAPKGKTAIVAPREVAEQATIYENALRDRPTSVRAVIHRTSNQALLQIGLTLTPPVMSALARLGFHGHAQSENIHVDWQLARETEISPSVDLSKLSRSLGSNTTDQPYNDLPATFTRPLWCEQKKALRWMIQKENENAYWNEIEREEVNVQTMAWRFDIKATKEVQIAGGVLADEVGAGKTTTCLALVDATTSQQDIPNLNNAEFTTGLIPSSATLILVPYPIVEQWRSEYYLCVPHGRDILVVKDASGLTNIPVERMATAKIVLAPFNLFEGNGYWDNLERVTNACCRPPKAGRGFQSWLQDALEGLGKFITSWIDVDLSDESKIDWLLSNLNKDVTNYKKYQPTPLPSKNKMSEKDDEEEDEGEEQEDDEDGKEPIKLPKARKDGHALPLNLHMFRFKRIIVDEFTFLSGKALLAILKLTAKSRWLLSGTPPIASFDKIDTIAQLLGSKVSSHYDQDGIFSFSKNNQGIANDQTFVEQFRQLMITRSANYINVRNGDAKAFVGQHVRQNKARGPDKDVKAIQHFIVGELSALEHLVYARCFQRIMDQSLNFNNKATRNGLRSHDLDQILSHHLAQASSREDALATSYAITMSPGFFWNSANVDANSTTFCNRVLASRSSVTFALGKSIFYGFKNVFRYLRERDEMKGEKKVQVLWPLIEKTVNLEHDDAELCQDFVSIVKAASNAAEAKEPNGFRDIAAILLTRDKVPPAPTAQQGGKKQAKKTIDQDRIDPKAWNKVFDTAWRTKGAASRRSNCLQNAMDAMIKCTRTARAFQNAKTVLSGAAMECNACQSQPIQPETSMIMTICGHIVCASCLSGVSSGNDEGECVVSGCKASGVDHQMLQAGLLTPTHAASPSPAGSKLLSVVRTLQAILQNERFAEDFVLVFVQYARLKRDLKEALELLNIAVKDGTPGKGNKPAQMIEEFKSQGGRPAQGPAAKRAKLTEPLKGKARVLILEIDSENAAGW